MGSLLSIQIQEGIAISSAKEMTEITKFYDRKTLIKRKSWRKAIKYFTVVSEEDRQILEEISGLEFCKLIILFYL